MLRAGTNGATYIDGKPRDDEFHREFFNDGLCFEISEFLDLHYYIDGDRDRKNLCSAKQMYKLINDFFVFSAGVATLRDC